MNLYSFPVDDEGNPLCADCHKNQDYPYLNAYWAEVPPSYECYECSAPVPMTGIVDPPRPLPEEEGYATPREMRALGWKCENDFTCEECDLAEFDGLVPVCPDCGRCEECGCECEEEEG